MNIITSDQNPVIKEIRSLKDKKFRQDRKLFCIEGIRFVDEALKENIRIEKILVSDRLNEVKGGNEILTKISDRKLQVFQVPNKLFRDVSDTENPQGILAVIGERRYNIDDIIIKEQNFLVVLDSLQDPGNMGTIIRTADAAGANGIIISKGCVDIYNSKVLRSTMGSIFHVPVYISESLPKTLSDIKGYGIKVYAAHLKGSTFYYQTSMRDNVAVVIGNEANGISEEVAVCADVRVKIPMPGRAESLNASVAAGLLMYEVARQRIRD